MQSLWSAMEVHGSSGWGLRAAEALEAEIAEANNSFSEPNRTKAR